MSKFYVKLHILTLHNKNQQYEISSKKVPPSDEGLLVALSEVKTPEHPVCRPRLSVSL
jgi:hypothetical protein